MQEELNKGISKRTIMASIIILLLIPTTIYIGIRYMGNRKYYFISLLIIIYTIIPFFISFENRKPKPREIIVIAVLSAIAVVGRAAFYMIPQFKPVCAIVIIAGIAFGGEAGFLTGSLAGFVSNFIFRQGPWTPWQMFSFGIIGFIAGLLFNNKKIKDNKMLVIIYGGLSTFIIYGLIMNLYSALTMMPDFSMKAYIASIISGIPFDLIHAAATVIFLFILYKPMMTKLDRIKIKYGFMRK
ncbi:ECF transporter S component [Clostridium sp. MSJ-8]|uniref:ECF transporter S component n=1 Tax=Clostridium sp. MSJ-8 TaxID=2841510 RepID=UPI001C0F0012|nr:ECF transporter S component [Clostridium sp. MSJ-8]MBU5487068.1 ECF transporter S component [Clostridium sp. MSJ-8]